MNVIEIAGGRGSGKTLSLMGSVASFIMTQPNVGAQIFVFGSDESSLLTMANCLIDIFDDPPKANKAKALVSGGFKKRMSTTHFYLPTQLRVASTPNLKAIAIDTYIEGERERLFKEYEHNKYVQTLWYTEPV